MLTKLGKPSAQKTWCFNLPAGKTCPGAGECRAWCYASGGRYRFPAVTEAHQRNLRRTRSETFSRDMIEDISYRGANVVRVHTSGDFYSQEYLNKWIAIAMALPAVTFYAYTKSLHLDFSQVPTNMVLIQSVGGCFDGRIDPSRPIARVFESPEELDRAGYTNAMSDDSVAFKCKRIGLVRH